MKQPVSNLMIALAIFAGAAVGAEELSLESASPVVIRTVPVAGSVDVDPTLTELTVTYSKPMKDGSWSWSTWGEDTFPETTGKPRYLDDGRTCVLPVKLAPGKFYATWLNSDRFKNFKDANGRPAVPYLLTFTTRGTAESSATTAPASSAPRTEPWHALLNEDQLLVVQWTDRQFRKFFDNRTFDGWSEEKRAELETQSLDKLNGPLSPEYYQAINTLGALRSTKAVKPLLSMATDRREKDNRDRWMAIRALGLIGDKSVVPELIHLVYHGNLNTRWWAQLSLVHLTGKNFANDCNAWGQWWNSSGGQPPFNPEIIPWYKSLELTPPKLEETITESDRKFLNDLRSRSSKETPATSTAQTIAPGGGHQPVADLPNAVVLRRDNGSELGFQSIAASGHAVRFNRTPGERYVEAVQFFASRYGLPEPPSDDFHLYLLNDQNQVLADLPFPYAMIERGDRKWYTLRTPSIEVPEQFTVALNFNPHKTKGVYLGYSEATEPTGHSLIGLPGDGFESWKKGEWMLRVSLTAQPTKAKGFQSLAEWKPKAGDNPFANCRIAAFGGDQSDGKQSYGGRGPAIRFKPLDRLPDLPANQPVTLKGVRIYASRYGSGYSPEETSLKVQVLDADGGNLLTETFAYAKLNYRVDWVDLAFEKPLTLRDPSQPVTIAFDPEATQFKGIYFHYQKNPSESHSLSGKSSDGFKSLPDREWMVAACFAPASGN